MRQSWRQFCERKSLIFGVVVAALLFFAASAASAEQVPAMLDCSAAEPQTSPAISYPIMFTRTGKKLLAARGTTERSGQESFHGSIELSGIVKMFGMGRFVDGSSMWSFTFASVHPDASGGATFNGNLRDKFGNTRSCKMTVQSGLGR
jgi:hypothetical protein